MGFVPHAFLDENTDGIFVGAPSWLLINSKSKNAEEAKKFLAFMAGTPEGHDFMVNKAGMIPAFKSVKLSPSGHLSKDVQAWAAQGKIYAWHQNKMPSGFGMDVLGPIFLELAAGNINTQDFVRLVTAEAAKLK
jgi:raffinose/stachyose/melibiose transport system substrate-binding protein